MLRCREPVSLEFERVAGERGAQWPGCGFAEVGEDRVDQGRFGEDRSTQSLCLACWLLVYH